MILQNISKYKEILLLKQQIHSRHRKQTVSQFGNVGIKRIFMNVNTDMRIELSENMRNYMRFHRDNIIGG